LQILDGGPSGQPTQFATIGQQVYHKWTCDSETVDTFCAVVHSCFVDDGSGDKVEILNSDGCALDKYLLNNLEYPTDLMAGQEAHVYKYADRSQLFYQCQISITIKEPNSDCARPQCSEPQGFGAVKSAAPKTSAALRVLKKRAAKLDVNTLDVRTDISTLDIIGEPASLPPSLRHRSANAAYILPVIAGSSSHSAGLCMSTSGFAMISALIFALFAAATIIVIGFLRSPSKA
uniref:ZP domain-containing protein n=1 Tax=Toxocara canis TaxID=6265 RepID=A0A183UXA3_TOXCA